MSWGKLIATAFALATACPSAAGAFLPEAGADARGLAAYARKASMTSLRSASLLRSKRFAMSRQSLTPFTLAQTAAYPQCDWSDLTVMEPAVACADCLDAGTCDNTTCSVALVSATQFYVCPVGDCCIRVILDSDAEATAVVIDGVFTENGESATDTNKCPPCVTSNELTCESITVPDVEAARGAELECADGSSDNSSDGSSDGSSIGSPGGGAKSAPEGEDAVAATFEPEDEDDTTPTFEPGDKNNTAATLEPEGEDNTAATLEPEDEDNTAATLEPEGEDTTLEEDEDATETTRAPPRTTVSVSTAVADAPGSDATEGASSTKTNSTEDSNKCFPADALAELEHGGIVRMDTLAIGDSVKVGPKQFSKVFMFTHKMADVNVDFVVIRTASGASLSLTGGHYIYANDALVAAATVAVGDELMLGHGERSAVTSVSHAPGRGLYNPQTLSGDIVVNGIVASTYTTAVDPGFAHSLLAPLRAMSRFGLGFTGLESGGGSLTSYAPSGVATVV